MVVEVPGIGPKDRERAVVMELGDQIDAGGVYYCYYLFIVKKQKLISRARALAKSDLSL